MLQYNSECLNNHSNGVVVSTHSSATSLSSSNPQYNHGLSVSLLTNENSCISDDSDEMNSEVSVSDVDNLQQLNKDLIQRNHQYEILSNSEIMNSHPKYNLNRISSEPSLSNATPEQINTILEGLTSPLIQRTNHVRIKSIDALESPVAPSLTGRQSNRYEGNYRLVCGCIPFKIDTVCVTNIPAHPNNQLNHIILPQQSPATNEYSSFSPDVNDKLCVNNRCTGILALQQSSTTCSNQVSILLVRSSKNDYWIFPKGGWENFESSEQAAQRECLEEAGVQGEIIAELGTYSWSKKAKHSRLTSYLLQVTIQHESFAEEYRDRAWCPIEYVRFFVQREEAKYFLEKAIEKMKELGLVKEEDIIMPKDYNTAKNNSNNDNNNYSIDGKTVDINSVLTPIPRAKSTQNTLLYTNINSGPCSANISPPSSPTTHNSSTTGNIIAEKLAACLLTDELPMLNSTFTAQNTIP